ncbi:MAG: hypothetical protein Q8R82_08625 [Hyphomonadaceae bacterium]|nr:hypothetical protein [Hyphomonadaceae bacterium]
MSKPAFVIFEGFVLPPVVTGPRIADSDLAIVEAVERDLADAHREGRRLSQRSALIRHLPKDADYFVNEARINQRRRVTHWLRKRRATGQL